MTDAMDGPIATIPRTVDLRLPWPPSTNTYWRMWQGRMLISKRGRAYRICVAVEAAKAGARQRMITGPVAVTIDAYPPDARKRDLDNLLKSALDSITHAGVWQDDSQVADLAIHRKGIDRKNARIEVQIVERKGT